MDKGKIVEIDSPDNLIDKLVKTGFKRPKATKDANLEDVFLHFTGRALNEED